MNRAQQILEMLGGCSEESLPSKIKVKPSNWTASEPITVSYNEKTGRFQIPSLGMFTLEKQKVLDTEDTGNKYDEIHSTTYYIRGDDWDKKYKLGTVHKWDHDKTWTASGTSIEREDANPFAAATQLLLNIV